MAATAASASPAASATATATATAAVLKEAKQSTQPVVEVEFAKCECCGLTEECTLAYIGRVRERFGGRWICGLCAEAVKDETSRSRKDDGDCSDDGDDDDGDGDADELEALKQHMKFCQQFRSSSPPTNPTRDLIFAMKHLLRRSLDSPRKKKGSVFPSSHRSIKERT